MFAPPFLKMINTPTTYNSSIGELAKILLALLHTPPTANLKRVF
jgi:hypothetical protein